MEMQPLLDYIAGNGFAIVVAVYMIVVNSKIVQENTQATNKMSCLIERLLEKEGYIRE